MTKRCNEQTAGFCPTCFAEVKIKWGINYEGKPGGGVHESAGDTFHVSQACRHIATAGGHAGGYDDFVATLKQEPGTVEFTEAESCWIVAAILRWRRREKGSIKELKKVADFIKRRLKGETT